MPAILQQRHHPAGPLAFPLGPDYRADVRKRSVDSIRCPWASLPAPSRPVRPSIGRREVGGNPAAPMSTALASGGSSTGRTAQSSSPETGCKCRPLGNLTGSAPRDRRPPPGYWLVTGRYADDPGGTSCSATSPGRCTSVLVCPTPAGDGCLGPT